MAIWTVSDTFELEGEDDEIIVQERTAGRYRAIMPGPFGNETTIEFTDIELDTKTIEFYREARSGRLVHTGSIEAWPDALGVFFRGFTHDE